MNIKTSQIELVKWLLLLRMKKLIAKIPDFLKLKLEFWKSWVYLSKTKFKKELKKRVHYADFWEIYLNECVLSELAENKLWAIFIRKLQFKSEEWSLTKLTSKIDQISDQPESCVQSYGFKRLF
jgi:hypothetical protein